MASELRRAFRSLAKSPWFTAASLILLVAGIGTTTVALQLLWVSAVEGPHLKEPERLFRLERRSTSHGLGRSSSIVFPVVDYVAAHTPAISTLITERTTDAVVRSQSFEGPLRVSFVSSNWFEELGYGASRGRVFGTKGDSRAAPVVVLSHEFWVSAFARNENVIGSTLWVNDCAVTVIGIADERFPGLRVADTQAWVPLDSMAAVDPGSQIGSAEVYGRMSAGVSAAQLQNQLNDTVGATLRAGIPGLSEGDYLDAYLGSDWFQRPDERQTRRSVLFQVLVLAVSVPLIAFANLSGLLFSRLVSKYKETGIRATLGANRIQLVFHMVAEPILLILGGTIGGVVVAAGAAPICARYLGIPSFVAIRIGIPSIVSAFAAGFVAFASIGIIPALRTTSRDVSLAILHSAARPIAVLGGWRVSLRHVFAGVQLAATCALLLVAGVIIARFARMRSPSTFSADRVAVLEIAKAPRSIRSSSASCVYLWSRAATSCPGKPTTPASSLASG